MNELQSTAAQIRQRLRNPPNGRVSSELEIINPVDHERRRRGLLAAANAAADREARLIRAARAQRASGLMQEYQFKLTAWVLEGAAEPSEPVIPRVLFEQILQAVSKFYDIPIIHITSKRRKTAHVKVRHVVMYLARELTEMSLPMIGAKIDRDHTTVFHGATKIAAGIAAGDQSVMADVLAIKQLLGAE